MTTVSITPNTQFSRAWAKVLRNGNKDFADKEFCPQTFESPQLKLESCQTHGIQKLRKECYKLALRRLLRKNFVYRLLSNSEHCHSHTKRTVFKKKARVPRNDNKDFVDKELCLQTFGPP